MGNNCTHFNKENIEDTMNCLLYVHGLKSNYSPNNVDYSPTAIKAVKSVQESSLAKPKS